jgi:uncharacterized membrane protein HdeD (DUF308 family)
VTAGRLSSRWDLESLVVEEKSPSPQHEQEPADLLSWLGELGVAAVVCLVVGLLTIAFRAHPIITSFFLLGCVVVGGIPVFLVLRTDRDHRPRLWEMALGILVIVAAAAATTFVIWLAYCACV